MSLVISFSVFPTFSFDNIAFLFLQFSAVEEKRLYSEFPAPFGNITDGIRNVCLGSLENFTYVKILYPDV
jgi:hypothetical protein